MRLLVILILLVGCGGGYYDENLGRLIDNTTESDAGIVEDFSIVWSRNRWQRPDGGVPDGWVCYGSCELLTDMCEELNCYPPCKPGCSYYDGGNYFCVLECL